MILVRARGKIHFLFLVDIINNRWILIDERVNNEMNILVNFFVKKKKNIVKFLIFIQFLFNLSLNYHTTTMYRNIIFIVL